MKRHWRKSWDLGDDLYTQTDIDFTAFMVSRVRYPKHPREPLFIPFDERRRRAYAEETERLRVMIHNAQTEREHAA